MFKYFFFLCCAIAPFLFFACGKKDSARAPSQMEAWMEKNGKLKVLSTTAMIDDLVAQVGREHVDHLSLIVGDLDPHTYELVKGDEEKLSFAQLVLCNGLGLEHGASVHYHLEKHPKAVFLGDEIERKCSGAILTKKGQKDPHLWMDISLWAQAIEPIVEALSELDPAHASVYKENGKDAFERMMQTHEAIKKRFLQVSQEKRFLVTSHDAFNYFARSYLSAPGEEGMKWQKRFVAPEGLAPDGQLSSLDIQKVINHLYVHKIKVLFPETNVSRGSLKKIVHACREMGLEVTIAKDPLYGDAMGPALSDADTYLKMIEHNALVLLSAWE